MAQHRFLAFNDNGNLLWNNMDTVSSNGKLKDPKAVAIGPNGYIYVADMVNDRIAKFGSEGTFVKTLNSTTLRAPVGIAVAKDGSVLVHDRKQRLDDIGEPQIYKFSPEGELFQSWGNKGREPGELWEAHGIAIGPDDTLWVAGYHGDNVLNFDLNGNLISEWNDHNIIGGEFALIQSAAVGKHGKAYVLDRWNQVVQVFDRYGGFQFMWGERGQGAGPLFDFPTNVATDHNGNVYLCDTRNVRKFDENGNILGRITGGLSFACGSVVERSGDIWVVNGHENEIIKYKQYNHFFELDFIIGSNDLLGGLNQPHGICQGLNGMIYVVNTFDHRIVRLDGYGNFDMTWGGYGKETGQFMAPCGLANDTQGRIYVSETRGDRIQVFTSEGDYLHGWGSKGTGPGKFGDIFDLALDTLPLPLMTTLNPVGRPSYTPAQDAGYFLWQDADDREWHLRWSGNSIKTYHYTGTILTNSHFYGCVVLFL